jgi:hypothetical protein
MSENLLLPRNLKYGSRRESASAVSSRVNIAPQNGTDGYGLGSNIIINIPTRRNLCLTPSESYLKFTATVTNTSGQPCTYRFDSQGAHSLIQRIRVIHGSNVLQDIDNYAMLAKILFDLQVNTPSSYGKLSILAGTRSDLVSSTLMAVADAVDLPTSQTLATAIKASLNVGMSVNQVNSGAIIANALATAGTSAVQTFCLNLISLVGSLCQQNYIPLWAIDSAPLRVEITLCDQINKIFGTSIVAGTPVAGTITVSSVEYVANFIELSDVAMGMVNDSLQGQPLQFVVPDYRNFQYTSALVSNQMINIPIPAKFSSLKSLFISVRDKYSTDNYFPYSSCMLGLQSYYFRVGPRVMPAKPPASQAEFFAECVKAIDSMGNLYHSPSIDTYSYSLGFSAAATLAGASASVGNQSSGSAYIALDVENYSNAPKDVIFAGMNTLTDDIYATFQYAVIPNGGAVASARYDIYALFDTVLVFENGTAYARY